VSQNPPVFNRKEFGLISDLAVKEQWRNKGLGRAIFYQIEAWFKSRGINRMELEVATTNEISQRFWQSLGFNPCRKKLYKEY
ncbi:MAG: GNAT family N-acetyltransferase, partial [Verrucomicrobiae bacterium]|nr:GNAT family N-acetyltransferase [Verrucomicrobiae bacterium]